jgi:alkylation response protein AidB-like acyl-CoA dehydrogenase
VKELFEGRLRLDLIHPFPEPTPEDVAKAAPFLAKLDRFLAERVDGDLIDRESKVPEDVIRDLQAMGAFGIKIPEEYGGLGLSQLMYTKAVAKITSVDGSLTALVSASPVDRRAGPPQAVRDRRAEKEVFPHARQGAISGVRAHRDRRGQRSRLDCRPAPVLSETASTGSSTARSSGAPTAPSPT